MLGNCLLVLSCEGEKWNMNCWNWVLSHFLTAVSSSMWSMPVLVGIFSPWRLLSTSLLSSYLTDSFLPLMNIFRSIARQTHPAVSFILSMITHLLFLHRWPFMNPVCAVRVRMEKFCQASAEWRCAGVCALRHALYRSTCAGKMGYFSWLRLAEWGREQDFGIIAVQTESRMRGVSCVWQCGEADCKMTAEVNRLLRIHRAG